MENQLQIQVLIINIDYYKFTVCQFIYINLYCLRKWAQLKHNISWILLYYPIVLYLDV